MSAKISLWVIPETALGGREILTVQPPATLFFWDHGANTYVCGKCKAVLAEDVGKLEMTGKVLKCNQCGSYNTL